MEEEKRFFPTEEQKLMAAGRQSSLAGTDIFVSACCCGLPTGSPRAPHRLTHTVWQHLTYKDW